MPEESRIAITFSSMPPSVAAATEAGGAREAAIFGGFGRGFAEGGNKEDAGRAQGGPRIFVFDGRKRPTQRQRQRDGVGVAHYALA